MVAPPPPSITEVRSYLSPQAYLKVRQRIRETRGDWCIIGFTSSQLILRLARINTAFDRQTGKVLNTHHLPPPPPTRKPKL